MVVGKLGAGLLTVESKVQDLKLSSGGARPVAPSVRSGSFVCLVLISHCALDCCKRSSETLSTTQSPVVHTGELDAWVNIDSDEGESCTSDWDSPGSSPPDSPRALTPDPASTGWSPNPDARCMPLCGERSAPLRGLYVHHTFHHSKKSLSVQDAVSVSCAGKPADGRSSEVLIAANGKMAAEEAEGKLAPSTPETTSQGAIRSHAICALRTGRDASQLLSPIMA